MSRFCAAAAVYRIERSRAIAASVEKRIWRMLTDGTPVVVTSHRDLDGDGVGAALALWHGLRNAGVRCAQYYEPPVPAAFEFLPGLNKRVGLEKLPKRFHLVVLDCGGLSRVGALARHAGRAERIINIDHHRTSEKFGDVNLIERQVSSCGELIFRVLQAGKAKLTKPIAQCLYTAILTDTGSFSYSNTTAEALQICARLVKVGVKPWELSEQVYGSPCGAVVRLKGLTLGTLKLEANGRVATMEITKQMFRRTSTRPVDTQGFADLPISIEGVQASALLKEIIDGGKVRYVKMSLRSRPCRNAVDVCSVAEAFGGGGHRHAAGCEFYGSLRAARRGVLAEIRRRLRPAAR